MPVMLLAGAIGGPDVYGGDHSWDFDAQRWRGQTQEERGASWPPRLCMVDDLIASRQLDGLDREGVAALLGSDLGRALSVSAEDRVDYYLGPFRGWIRIDYEWLSITFGADGKVTRYWIQTN